MLPTHFSTWIGTVLVVEYGTIEDAPGVFEPPSAKDDPGKWNLESLPIAGLNNRTAYLTIGKTVGGSSAVNGQFFDRGSKHDYDAWMAVGKPEFDNSTDRWDWNGLLPFFKKVWQGSRHNSSSYRLLRCFMV